MHVPDEFASRVEPAATGCWLWKGAINNGYGRVYSSSGLLYAHRVVFEKIRGPIPKDLVLDHLCRERRCVNPEHLEIVTTRENSRRGLRGVLITHCPKGHLYDDMNTSLKNGWRRCRICHNEQERARRAARKNHG